MDETLRIRQQEYTGENRCMPCTVVNVGIATAASAILAVIAPTLAPIALGLFLAIIYLRGYLVPGTPELTERYVPDRVLGWFDKAPSPTDAPHVETADGGDEIDPEPILREADVVELTPDGTDLQLTDGFRTEWSKRIVALREGGYELQLARLLGGNEEVDPDAVEVQIDDRNATVLRDDTPVATWPSEAALIADLAAAPLLRNRLQKAENTNLSARGQLLHAIRVFLERCPTCDGTLALSEETVESCCKTAEVATLTCRACDAIVLEVDV